MKWNKTSEVLPPQDKKIIGYFVYPSQKIEEGIIHECRLVSLKKFYPQCESEAKAFHMDHYDGLFRQLVEPRYWAEIENLPPAK